MSQLRGFEDKELERLRPNLPSMSEPPAVFFGKLEQTINATKRARSLWIDNLEKGGFQTEGFRLGGEGIQEYKLKNPDTGEVLLFDLTPADLEDAQAQGWELQ